MSRSKLIGAALAIVGIVSVSPSLLFAQQQGGRTAVPRVTQQAPGVPEATRSDTELQRALGLWEDIIHYYRIAQHDLAVSSAKAFDDIGLNSPELLRVVEELSPYDNYDRTLVRASELEGEPGQVAQDLLDRIREARLAMSREGTRVRESIESLDQGLRHRRSSHEQLRRAGQYAAPHLLDALTSPDARDRELAPYVMRAMEQVGRPIVSPLAESLSGLEATPKQQVAQVLATIGYPLALPYLKAEIEREDISDETRSVLQRAFNQIAENSRASTQASAADLFLTLAEDYYLAHSSLILEPNESHNIMWSYSPQAGLTFRQIPTPVFHDAMAMRTSRRALQLNPNLSPALSLWVTANFRRENNLPEGEEDPSYGEEMRSPHYYATLAGPRHLQPVLQRALRDRDADLALDAIAALSSTATADSLLNLDGRMQPLLAALNYPDRRVRFDAAITIATARPNHSFDGAQRVVPVLAEAVREAGELYAVVLGPDNDAMNRASQLINDAGDYRTLRGASVDVVAAQVAEAPGVDLVVINSPFAEAQSAVANVRQNFKMMGTPVVVIAEQGDAVSLRRGFEDRQNVFVVEADSDEAEIASTIREATGSVTGSALSADDADYYASTAVGLLREITLGAGSPAFDALDAQPALVAALDDSRDHIALGAAEIVARFPGEQVQRELATHALSTDRGQEMQVAFLQTLATSARIHGNQLSRTQLRDLVELVNGAAPGSLADAAAEAHGALNLPTANVIETITN